MSETKADHAGIVWIASYPKSGSTWARVFLHNLLSAMQNGEKGPASINRMAAFTTWEIGAKSYEKFLGKHPQHATREEIAAARPKVQASIAERADGELALVKTHSALVRDRGVPTINLSVTSGAIYIVRNPLDVAISYAHHMARSIDDAIAKMATVDAETHVRHNVVYEVQGSWSQHVASWTRKPHRAIQVLRFEDMLERPDIAFANLAKHLLLTPTAEQLQTAIEYSSFEQLKEQERREGFKEKPAEAERFFREGRSGQWREQLTDQQIRAVVVAHAAEMSRFDYLPLDFRNPRLRRI